MRLMAALLGKLRLLVRAQMIIHAVRSRSGLVCVRRAKMNLSSMNVFGCRHNVFPQLAWMLRSKE